MSKKITSTCFVHFEKDLCAGRGTCLPVCPTKAIRMKNKKAVRIVEQCIGCGECIRVCRESAVSAATEKPEMLGEDHIAIALVSPVLYAQFPGVMPKDVLLGLR
ncbi:MAG: 4Fe-4S binding protein, partial [Deltaproteobacteria bacterium]|nr:4Fe-4S binding protein [Deltaproteobacteria bacterium]